MTTPPHFDNRITELFGVEVPIANSPMGFVVKPDLVAAVANAGGLHARAQRRRDEGAPRRHVVRHRK